MSSNPLARRSLAIGFSLMGSFLTGLPPALAELEITPGMRQLTTVNQLSDVQPTDWAFQALQSLVERYDCLAGYSDGTFRGNRAMTRSEFAAGLNACLERINQFIATATPDLVPTVDRQTLTTLQENFAAELASLRGRVEALDTRTTTLEKQSFATTTKLTGQVVVVGNAGGVTGNTLVDPNGRAIANTAPNATTIYRVALDFNTSFSGSDLLKLRLGTGSGGANDNAAAVLEPNFGSGLDFSSKPPAFGTLEVLRLYYTFKPSSEFTVSIGPDIRITDFVDFNRYANLGFRDFSTEALVNNYILFPVSGPTSGASVTWNPAQVPLAVRALYAVADAANPGNQGLLKGTAPFVRLLYPIAGNPLTADLGDRGLFGQTYQGYVEVEYAPSNTFTLRLQYSGGSVFEHRFDVVGLNAELTLAKTIGLFGRYGYGRYTNTAFGTLRPHYWMAGVAMRDIWLKGSQAGIAIGQPFIENTIGNATQTNLEAFYTLPINDSIRITPLVQVITHPSNQAANGTIITGSVRTVFAF